MLEKMADFFERRIDGYDEHMKKCIVGADEFYRYTAERLPKSDGAKILDLGCGTGLELEEYFHINPTARVTGIDLSRAMLASLSRKFPDKEITLICASYFDTPLGIEIYDAALSVESMHHFTMDEKIPLYKKIRASLVDGGYFILTDYFAETDEDELLHRNTLNSLKRLEGICDDEFYHYDTPLTAKHECDALCAAGFSDVFVLRSWESTKTLCAKK